jgi:cytochrome c-type biogenesis protein CcmF
MPENTAELVAAPQWGMLLGQLGKASVIFSIVSFLIALALCPTQLVKLRRIAFLLGSASVLVTFIALAGLFLGDQFQFEYVWGHSDSTNTIPYKISAIWTAQQGSFMLWAVFSAVFACLTFYRSGVYERAYTGFFAVFLGVLCGILAYETPFNIIPETIKNGVTFLPANGNGMVPSLQNYWNIIHPPTMFVGFASLGVPFAYGFAAMIHGNTQDWAQKCRSSVLFGLSLQGLGIVMGGLWAYETQGWGGFWAWDPVENVALVPWLFLVALAHGIIVQATKKIWHRTNLFLSGLPFLLFAYGTFLTRSGLLDKVSVHSFASMDRSALIVLRTFLIAVVAAFLTLFAWRGLSLTKKSAPESAEPGVDRTSAYSVGVISISLLAFVIALGMSWPVITALRGGEGARVEQTVYHRAVIWFFVPILLAMAIGPFVSWRKQSIKTVLNRMVTLLSISVGLVGITLLVFKNPTFGVGMRPNAVVSGLTDNSSIPLVAAVTALLLLCYFTAVTNVWRVVELFKRTKLGVGSFVAHFGIAVLLGGLIISKGLEQKEQVFVRAGLPTSALGYVINFNKIVGKDLSDRAGYASFDITSPSGEKFEAKPGFYYYPSSENGQPKDKAQIWPYVHRTASHDIYFSMQEPTITFWKQPMMIKPGETLVADQITVKYLRPTMKGNPGSPGAEFGGVLEFSYKDNGEIKTYQANPTMAITDEGMVPTLPKVGPDFRVVANRMDAATKGLELQLMVDPPIYAVEFFYKPLTILVWIGTGIFTLGGLMSAFYRRQKLKSKESDYAKIESSDAIIPTA